MAKRNRSKNPPPGNSTFDQFLKFGLLPLLILVIILLLPPISLVDQFSNSNSQPTDTTPTAATLEVEPDTTAGNCRTDGVNRSSGCIA